MRVALILCSLLFFVACPKPKEPTSTQPAPTTLTSKEAQPASKEAAPTSEATPPTEKITPKEEVTPPKEAKTPAETAKTPVPTETYRACGCGCCGGVEPRNTTCIYRSKGESLEKIKADDQKSRERPGCAMVGCSLGTLYKYCD